MASGDSLTSMAWEQDYDPSLQYFLVRSEVFGRGSHHQMLDCGRTSLRFRSDLRIAHVYGHWKSLTGFLSRLFGFGRGSPPVHMHDRSEGFEAFCESNVHLIYFGAYEAYIRVLSILRTWHCAPHRFLLEQLDEYWEWLVLEDLYWGKGESNCVYLLVQSFFLV